MKEINLSKEDALKLVQLRIQVEQAERAWNGFLDELTKRLKIDPSKYRIDLFGGKLVPREGQDGEQT